MDTIITDGGKYEISKKFADVCRSLFMKQYESEPYHQHQNITDQHYGAVNRYINTLMNLKEPQPTVGYYVSYMSALF